MGVRWTSSVLYSLKRWLWPPFCWVCLMPSGYIFALPRCQSLEEESCGFLRLWWRHGNNLHEVFIASTSSPHCIIKMTSYYPISKFSRTDGFDPVPLTLNCHEIFVPLSRITAASSIWRTLMPLIFFQHFHIDIFAIMDGGNDVLVEVDSWFNHQYVCSMSIISLNDRKGREVNSQQAFRVPRTAGVWEPDRASQIQYRALVSSRTSPAYLLLEHHTYPYPTNDWNHEGNTPHSHHYSKSPFLPITSLKKPLTKFLWYSKCILSQWTLGLTRSNAAVRIARAKS